MRGEAVDFHGSNATAIGAGVSISMAIGNGGDRKAAGYWILHMNKSGQLKRAILNSRSIGNNAFQQ